MAGSKNHLEMGTASTSQQFPQHQYHHHNLHQKSLNQCCQSYSCIHKITGESPGSSTSKVLRPFLDSELVDQLSVFFERHKALEVTFVWMFFQSLNFLTALPLEWIFFLYFTVTIFVQAYELGVAVFSVLLAVILGVDFIIFFFIPYKYTAFNASCVVHTFLVYGMHGFGLTFDSANLRGWILVVSMLVFRFTLWNPWGLVEPPLFMSPVAAHCSGFGICYLLWKLAFYGYKNFNVIVGIFGVSVPIEPVITVRDITDRSFTIHWNQSQDKSKLADRTVYSYSPAEERNRSKQTGHQDSRKRRESIPNSNGTTSPYPTYPKNSSIKLDPETKKFLIDINGVVIGESAATDFSVAILGLTPDTRYRVRVWALATNKIKEPSNTVLVRTCKDLSEDAAGGLVSADKLNGTTKDTEGIREQQTPPALPLRSSSVDDKSTQAAAVVEVNESADSITASSATASITSHSDKEVIRKLELDLEVIRIQQTELDTSIQRLLDSHNAECTKLKSEIENLKSARKESEPGRQEQKLLLKQLEDDKKEADSKCLKLNKLLRELSSDCNAAGLRVEDLQKELQNTQIQIAKLDTLYEETKNSSLRRKEELTAQIKEPHDKISNLEQRLEAEKLEWENLKSEMAKRISAAENAEKNALEIAGSSKSASNFVGWGSTRSSRSLSVDIDLSTDLGSISIGTDCAAVQEYLTLNGCTPSEINAKTAEFEEKKIEIERLRAELYRLFLDIQQEYSELQTQLRDESRHKTALVELLKKTEATGLSERSNTAPAFLDKRVERGHSEGAFNPATTWTPLASFRSHMPSNSIGLGLKESRGTGVNQGRN